MLPKSRVRPGVFYSKLGEQGSVYETYARWFAIRHDPRALE